MINQFISPKVIWQVRTWLRTLTRTLSAMAEARERFQITMLCQLVKNLLFSIAMSEKVFEQFYDQPQQLEIYLSVF